MSDVLDRLARHLDDVDREKRDGFSNRDLKRAVADVADALSSHVKDDKDKHRELDEANVQHYKGVASLEARVGLLEEKEEVTGQHDLAVAKQLGEVQTLAGLARQRSPTSNPPALAKALSSALNSRTFKIAAGIVAGLVLGLGWVVRFIEHAYAK